MPDREKVIKGIQYCLDGKDCTECPYDDDADYLCEHVLQNDALTLLKEQEAVKPKIDGATVRCGSCNSQVWLWATTRDAELFMFKAKYCPECGKKVLWE